MLRGNEKLGKLQGAPSDICESRISGRKGLDAFQAF
jgi:hypothetical protein